MTGPHVTEALAIEQANSLTLYARLPQDPGLARLIWRTIANPCASSDTLLILADALRDPFRPALTPLADAIAALAPTRAPKDRA